MAQSVKCGIVCVEMRDDIGDFIQKVCVKFETRFECMEFYFDGLDYIVTSLLYEMGSWCGHEGETAEQFYARRREKISAFLHQLESVRTKGYGRIVDVDSSNCDGGIYVDKDAKATLSFSRLSGLAGSSSVRLSQQDTKDLITALKRFAETWAEDAYEDWKIDEEGEETYIGGREHIVL